MDIWACYTLSCCDPGSHGHMEWWEHRWPHTLVASGQLWQQPWPEPLHKSHTKLVFPAIWKAPSWTMAMDLTPLGTVLVGSGSMGC